MCGHVVCSEPKARKVHRCEACSVPIPKGFTYVRSIDFYEGTATTNRWHVECWAEFGRMLTENFEECGDPHLTWENGMPQEIAQKYVHLVLEPSA